MIDILVGGGASYPSSLTNVNGTLFFSANDGTHGDELWTSDGTSAGTTLVRNIGPTSDGSYPSELTNVNGTLFFAANDGTDGYELWKSNGTSLGTTLVRNIGPTSDGSYPDELTNVNGTLFFSADDGITGRELWKSDGTSAGTTLVKEIRTQPGTYPLFHLTNVNGTLFFSANDGVHGWELWKSDGTSEETTLVKDIRVGPDSAGPRSLTNVNGTLFFLANDGAAGFELWKSDGTEIGTTLVKDIDPRAGIGSRPLHLTNVNGTLFFSADDGVNGPGLWKSDGTDDGTALIKQVRCGGVEDGFGWADVNGILFFVGDDGTTGYELWTSDGTTDGTSLVKDIDSGSYYGFPSDSSPWELTNVNGTLFFSADDGVTGRELWMSDGTTGGTTLVKDIDNRFDSYGYPYGGHPEQLTNVNGMLFFTADDGTHGRELWSLPSEPAAAGTLLASQDGAGNWRVEDVAAAGMNNRLTIQLINGGTELEISDANEQFISEPSGGVLSNEKKTLTFPLALVTGVLTIDTRGGNDTLTVDFSGGNPIPSGGLTFNGGDPTSGSPGDALVLDKGTWSGSFNTITHTFFSESDGSVSLDLDGPAGDPASTIAYTGLEPIGDNLDAANRVFTFTGGAETITLTDAGAGTMDIDSDAFGEIVTNFPNPTASLTINAGTGNDIVNITSVGTGFAASLTINGDAGTDSILFDSALSLASDRNLSATAETIVVNSAITTAGAGTILLDGSGATGLVTIAPILTTASGSVTVRSGGAVSFSASGGVTSTSGTIELDAVGDITLGHVNTGNNTAAAVDIRTTSGGVVDGGDASVDIVADASGAVVTIRAATGIGSLGPLGALETQIATLDAVNASDGDIRISEVAAGGDLDVRQARVVGGTGSILLSVASGNLTVLDGGVYLDESNWTGSIWLDANVPAAAADEPLRGNVVLNGVVLSGNTVTITADHDVTGSTAGEVRGNKGVSITADDNNGGPGSGDNGTIQLSGPVQAPHGTITFSLADCDGWIGDSPGSLSGAVDAQNIVMGVDAVEGVLRLQGRYNYFRGTTTVVQGTLLVNGYLRDDQPADPAGGDVVVEAGGVLGGHGDGTLTGVIDASITVLSGGVLDPGDVSSGCAPQTGRLTVNVPAGANLDVRSGGTFRVQLGGSAAGDATNGYDQLVLNGTATLNGTLADGTGGGALEVQLASGYSVPAGAEYVIISNDSTDQLTTRFLDLPEGASLTAGSGSLDISYLSGTDANDVVLTPSSGVTIPDVWRFDFNGFHDYTAAGYTGVSPWQTKAGHAFGWQTLPPRYFERTWPVIPPYGTEEERLKYDGHQTDRLGNPLTFEVDVVAGRAYQVTILTGDATWNHDRQQFTVSGSGYAGATQVIDTWGAGAIDGSGTNVTWGGGTANTNGTGFYRWVPFTTDVIAPVSGDVGKLYIRMQDLGGYDPTAVILGLDIRPVEAVGQLTILRAVAGTDPLPADGLTVDQYRGTGAPPFGKLTVTTSAGTPLQYARVTPDGDVTLFGTQLTADGNGAFAFSVLRPATLTTSAETEDWTIRVSELSGQWHGTLVETYAAPGADDTAPLRFDFGISGSPVQAGFLPVIPQTTYNPTRGYGWTSRVAGANRRDTSMSELRRDLNYAGDATFKVDLPNGAYSVRIYHSNPKFYGVTTYIADNFRVYAEGAVRYTVADIPAGSTEIQTFTVTVSDGVLDLRFQDFGGRDRNFVVSGIEISAGTLPTAAPLLAAGDPLDCGAASITTADLAPVVAAATVRWVATGLTPEQTAALETVRYRVADLGGAYLGLADLATNSIRIDDDAARLGWALVGGRRSEVGGRRAVDDRPGTGDQGRRTDDGLDLLTVVMHELGHLLGYGHSDDPDDLMAPVLSADAQLPRHNGMERYERELDLWFAELGEDS